MVLQRRPLETGDINPEPSVGRDRRSAVRPANANLEALGWANAQSTASNRELVEVRDVTHAIMHGEVVDRRRNGGGRGSGETFGADSLRNPHRRNREINSVPGVREDERRRGVDVLEIREHGCRCDFEQETEQREFQRIGQLSGLLDVGFRFRLRDATERCRLSKLALEEDQFDWRTGCRYDFSVIQRLLQRTQQCGWQRL